jgi:amidase
MLLPMSLARPFLVLGLLWAAPLTAQESPTANRAETLVVEGSVDRLQEALRAGDVTSRALVEAYLDRISAYDHAGPALNSMIRLNPQVLEEADALDRERRNGRVRGPLHGIPIVLKDNYDTEGLPTTASTVAFGGLLPRRDAFQVRKLREAGAILIGKTNLHELASGITTISSLGGQTRNPYDPARSPGGSSGGTSAAIAASFAALGWGSDTCGSIRIPAAENNLVGLRPTKGLSSIAGIIPLSHTQDTGGPLARTVRDLALALDATVGLDPDDSATRALEGRTLAGFAESLDAGALRGARIGILRGWFQNVQADMDAQVRAALAEMERQGAVLVPVDFSELEGLLSNTSVIDFELKPDLEDYLAGVPNAPLSSLTALLDAGLHHEALNDRLRARDRTGVRDSPEYRERMARQAALRDAITRKMDEAGVDVLALSIMAAEPAFHGAPPSASSCTLSANSGLPSMSLPVGFTRSALPVGMELLGRAFDDVRLVSLAYALEQAAPQRRAPLQTPPLQDRRAPAPHTFSASAGGSNAEPGFTATLRLDLPSAHLSWRVALAGVSPDDVHALVLERRGGPRPASVVHQLLGPERGSGEGELTLPAHLLEDLLNGHLSLGLYTRTAPLGAARAPLRVAAEAFRN